VVDLDADAHSYRACDDSSTCSASLAPANVRPKSRRPTLGKFLFDLFIHLELVGRACHLAMLARKLDVGVRAVFRVANVDGAHRAPSRILIETVSREHDSLELGERLLVTEMSFPPLTQERFFFLRVGV
jgi:hypothetical protein